MEKLHSRETWLRILLAGGLTVLLCLHPLPNLLRMELQNAQLEILNGVNVRASESLLTASELQPWRTELRLQAARLAYRGSDYSAAAAIYASLSQEDGLTSQDWMRVAEACVKTGNLPQAEDAWMQALAEGHDPFEIYYRQLEIYQTLPDPLKTIEILKKLVQLRPNQPELYYRLGMLLSAHSPQDALVYLEQAGFLNPALDARTSKLRQNIRLASVQDEPAYTLVQAGRALAEMNEWELASQAFSDSTTLRPDYAEGWAYYAESLQHLEQVNPQEPRTLLEKAAQIDPSSTVVYTLFSLYWSRQGKVDEALTNMKQAAQLNPDSAVFQMELGRLYALQGDFYQAQSAYERAVHLAPLDAFYRRALAGFFLQYHLDIRQTALPIARQLVIDTPRDPAALDIMGQVLFALEDHYGALRFFERAISVNPEYAPALLHMGSLYLYLGEAQQAQVYINLADELAAHAVSGEQVEGFSFP